MGATGIECERCHDEIERWEDGWLEWLYAREPRPGSSHSFRIVHHIRCGRRDDEIKAGERPEGWHLTHFVGIRGIERFALVPVIGGAVHGKSFGDVMLALIKTARDGVPSRCAPHCGAATPSKLRREESGVRVAGYLPAELEQELRMHCARERRSVSDALTEAVRMLHGGGR
jgi:hypothetical protein